MAEDIHHFNASLEQKGKSFFDGFFFCKVARSDRVPLLDCFYVGHVVGEVIVECFGIFVAP